MLQSVLIEIEPRELELYSSRPLRVKLRPMPRSAKFLEEKKDRDIHLFTWRGFETMCLLRTWMRGTTTERVRGAVGAGCTSI